MGKTLGWLHLSDLHFLDKKDWQNSPVLEHLLEKLTSDVAALRKRARRIDVVFCTGDIGFGQTSDEALSAQYDTAKKFFDRVLAICDLGAERLFLVPGNHDIDRKEVSESLTEFFRSTNRTCKDINQRFSDGNREVTQAMKRLEQYKRFVATHYPLMALDANANFAVNIDVDGIRLAISGLNSAWTCVDNKDQGNIWLAGEAQLAACKKALAPDAGTPDLRIALIHHPLNAFHRDETAAGNGVLEAQFDFLLHGHTHDQWVKETPHPHHIVVSAGAGTADGRDEFGYNFAQFQQGAAEIHLRSYSKKGGGGWVPEAIPQRTDDLGVWPLEKPPACFAGPGPTSGSVPTPGSVPAPSPSFSPSSAPNNFPTPTFFSTRPIIPMSGNLPVLGGAASRGHFGLDELLAQCTAKLKTSPLLALCGMAGVGKTVIVNELRQLPPWRDLHRVVFTVQQSSGIDDVFGALASVLGIHDERPRAPTGKNATEMAAQLRAMSTKPPAPFFLHVERGHLWLDCGQWRRDCAPIANLLAALVKAYPGSVVVLETREMPTTMEYVLATGLSKAAMVQYLAAPPGLPGAGWALKSTPRDYIFQRMGGGHGHGAHAFGLFLLAQLAASKATTPETILREHADALTDELYIKLFRDIYDNVLNSAERALLFACSLYRTGLHYSHLPRLETALPAPQAGAALVRRRLLTEDGEWLYLHDLAAEQAHKLETDPARVQAVHRLIASFWLTDLQGQNALLEANIRRALEALYHLEQGGEGHRVSEIAADLLGQRPGEAAAILWRMQDTYYQRDDIKKASLILDFLLKVAPADHKAMRFLGGYRRKRYGQADARALELFRDAVHCHPGYPHYWANFGHAAMACGAQTRREFLTEIAGAPPAAIDDQVAAIHASALQADGRDEEASVLRQAKINDGSTDAVFYADEAKWRLAHLNDSKGALEVLELARKNGCANDFTDAIYADALQADGRGGEASALRRARIDAGNTNPAFYNDEAKCRLAHLNDPKGALEVLELAHKNGCADDVTDAIYADALQADGRDGKASALRRAKIAAGSTHAAFYNDEVKWLFDHQDDRQGALAVLELARKNGCATEVIDAIQARIARG